MLGGRQPGADLVGFADSQPCRRDLGRLVLEQLEASGQLARLDGELGQRGAVRAPAGDGVGDRAPCIGVAAIRVEQVPLPALIEEALLVVLAMDLDEGPGHVRQPARGDGLIVEPRRRSPRRRHLADRDQRLR